MLFFHRAKTKNKAKQTPRPPLHATALFYVAWSYCHKNFADLKLRQVAVVMTVGLKNSRRYLNPERPGTQKTKTN